MNDKLKQMIALTPEQKAAVDEAFEAMKRVEDMGVNLLFDRKNDEMYAINMNNLGQVRYEYWCPSDEFVNGADGFYEVEFWETPSYPLYFANMWSDDHMLAKVELDKNLFVAD